MLIGSFWTWAVCEGRSGHWLRHCFSVISVSYMHGKAAALSSWVREWTELGGGLDLKRRILDGRAFIAMSG